METHNYKKFAKEYAELDIDGTYFLAYRDLPELIEKYVQGKKALDHGSGAGRSSRLLKSLGFETIGVDTSSDMVEQARLRNPEARYEVIESGKFPLEDKSVDLVLSSIVFMEFPTKEKMMETLTEMRRVLKDNGVVIIITDTPEAYSGDFVSFSFNFPDNKNLKSGDKARVVIKGTGIILYDYVWLDEDYREVFARTGFDLLESRKPTPKGDEPYQWHSETTLPPWVIYVLKKKIHNLNT